jgi:hypothetical protein
MTAVNDRVDEAAKIGAVPAKLPTWQRGYSRRLLAIDFIGVTLAVGLAQWLRFGDLTGEVIPAGLLDYSSVSPAIAGIWIAALTVNHSRSPRIIGSGAEEYRRVLLATLAVFGGVAIVSMLFKLEIARGYLMIALPAGMVFLVLFRWLARQVVARVRQKHGRCITRVLGSEVQQPSGTSPPPYIANRDPSTKLSELVSRSVTSYQDRRPRCRCHTYVRR